MAVAKERIAGRVKTASSRKTTATSRKPRSKTGGQATEQAKTEAPEEKLDEQKLAAAEGADGNAVLRKSINVQVVLKADAIAEGLAAMAAKGNPTCARLLVDLMAGKKIPPKKLERAMGQARELKLDAAWKGPEEQGTEEQGLRD